MVYWLHTDHLGSVSLLTDYALRITAQRRFLPYGGERYTEGTFPTDIGFTGQRGQAGLGLVYMRARYYHPRLGRFVSADTVVPEPGNPQALNRFAYVLGNPLKHVDPSGHANSKPPMIEGECALGACRKKPPVPTWRGRILSDLLNAGPTCRHAAAYIINEDVQIGFAQQNTGARWTVAGNIELNPDDYSMQDSITSNPDRYVDMLGAIVHEADHLGYNGQHSEFVFPALSLVGEAHGFEAEIGARIELESWGRHTTGNATCCTQIGHPIWLQAARMSDPPTDQELRQFRATLFNRYHFEYLGWALPGRPFLTQFTVGVMVDPIGRYIYYPAGR